VAVARGDRVGVLLLCDDSLLRRECGGAMRGRVHPPLRPLERGGQRLQFGEEGRAQGEDRGTFCGFLLRAADGGVEVVGALAGVVISVVQGLELRDGCRSLVLESVGSADHPPDEQHGGRDRDSQHAPDHGRNPVVSAMSAS
jgi:hypothetical protein